MAAADAMIYFDQSATSLHKPPEVVQAVQQALGGQLGNPARGAHGPALAALKALGQARRAVAGFFGVEALDLAFTSNATLALNLALKGALSPGDRVLTTCFEHNAMLRPLYQLQAQDLALDVAPMGPDGSWSLEAFKQALTPDTTALAINAMSNITGQVAPLAQLAQLCLERDLLLILDLSQWAGTRPLPDLPHWPRSLLAFTGHKSLYGIQGAGGLIKKGDISLRPVITGGSGLHSFDHAQPSGFPEICEAGTPNLPAILGLAAGINWLQQTGMEQVTARLAALRSRFVAGLAQIPGIEVYGDQADNGPVVALNLAGWTSAALSQALDQEHGIATRPGAHCAPLWHEARGLVQQGAVRFSFSAFNTAAEIDSALAALAALSDM